MYILIELVGIFFFAVAGSLMAARRGFDILGSAFLGGVCGLGGGVVRDLILNESPATFEHPHLLCPAGFGSPVRLRVHARSPEIASTRPAI